MKKQAYLLDLDLLKSAFIANPEKVIKELYYAYREEYIGFAKKMTRDKEKIIDSYQDAIIAMHENMMWNKINENNSSVKTYLFTIGKYKLLNAIEREKMMKKADNLYDANEFVPMMSVHLSDEVKDDLVNAISQLGETCQKLLQYFYYRRYSIEAIMHTMDMKNENSVKANKSRCVKQLRDIMKNITIKR